MGPVERRTRPGVLVEALGTWGALFLFPKAKFRSHLIFLPGDKMLWLKKKLLLLRVFHSCKKTLKFFFIYPNIFL
jgi:hypothetical protein